MKQAPSLAVYSYFCIIFYEEFNSYIKYAQMSFEKIFHNLSISPIELIERVERVE